MRRNYTHVSDDDDTDSVASSTSSIHSHKMYHGVSPLNRRRSLRIANMEAETSPHPALLARQSTTHNLRAQLAGTTLGKRKSSKPEMTRMETSHKWSGWRRNAQLSRQETLQVPGLQKMDTLSPPPIQEQSGKLNRFRSRSSRSHMGQLSDIVEEQHQNSGLGLKRKSTTHDLRQQLGMTSINNKKPKMAVPETKPAARKRKASQDPARTQGPPNKTKPRLKKDITIIVPEETEKSSLTQPKRQATKQCLTQESNGGPSRAKRLKTSMSLIKPLNTKEAGVYVPPKTSWPVQMEAQVPWCVVLRDSDGESVIGSSVHVSEQCCLIGDQGGSVTELDATVTPVRTQQLESAVSCIISCNEKTYAASREGKIYDVTNEEPFVMLAVDTKSQLLDIDAAADLFAASDVCGNITLYDSTCKHLWTSKSKGKLGWMVSIDDTGVFHGHSEGLTKYSLEDGSELWHTKFKDSVMSGVKQNDAIYVTSGYCIHKVNKITGEVELTYEKGKTFSSAKLHCCAVGSGLVFAGGTKLICYDEESGDVVYVVDVGFSPTSMMYFERRLFCTGPGTMTVVDFTEESVKMAQSHKKINCVEITPDPEAPVFNKVTSSEPPPSTSAGVLIECVKPKHRQGKICVRALSSGWNKHWEVSVPEEKKVVGAKFLVDDLKKSGRNSYKVVGELKEVD